ncbi:sucrase ferredoxin [Corynebacterium sp. 13CS0277]|uniref:sucrase ferredoxin n=1 Tax=Corynebacterium sp. 13CS0277 TaxID=2071994 RepID=UPI000D047816|nr:sucrase ferredoxin [Corynebacterium sp. 13CS0277]PRQ11387.1 sucrase ferredoxin [Corynebacterium sp. 13CS0277]
MSAPSLSSAAPTSPRCSTQLLEDLPGTAKTGTVYVVLEYHYGWGHDVLDDDVFGPELAAAMRGHLKKYGASLQLVRKPGRAGQDRPQRTLYVVHTGNGVTAPWARRLEVTGPSDVLEIDLATPESVGGEPVEHPLLLVCTHGKRDMCCALRGRPLAASLQATFPGDEVWESSHTKGHRFAPSVILLPWGYSFGRLDAAAAKAMLQQAARGRMVVDGNRGRGCFDAPGQVAELAVAAALLDAGEDLAMGALHVTEESSADEELQARLVADLVAASPEGYDEARLLARTVIHPDGRVWEVLLAQDSSAPVMASCGAAAKPQTTYRAVFLRAAE